VGDESLNFKPAEVANCGDEIKTGLRNYLVKREWTLRKQLQQLSTWPCGLS
jgi:hypothetical protein